MQHIRWWYESPAWTCRDKMWMTMASIRFMSHRCITLVHPCDWLFDTTTNSIMNYEFYHYWCSFKIAHHTFVANSYCVDFPIISMWTEIHRLIKFPWVPWKYQSSNKFLTYPFNRAYARISIRHYIWCSVDVFDKILDDKSELLN